MLTRPLNGTSSGHGWEKRPPFLFVPVYYPFLLPLDPHLETRRTISKFLANHSITRYPCSYDYTRLDPPPPLSLGHGDTKGPRGLEANFVTKPMPGTGCVAPADRQLSRQPLSFSSPQPLRHQLYLPGARGYAARLTATYAREMRKQSENEGHSASFGTLRRALPCLWELLETRASTRVEGDWSRIESHGRH